MQSGYLIMSMWEQKLESGAEMLVYLHNFYIFYLSLEYNIVGSNRNLMPKKPLFEGLVIDEQDRVVEVIYVGDDPCYVVDDIGFRRHIPAEQVDRQVLESMSEMIEGHEEFLSEQTAKMLGQEDIFSQAMISSQLKNIDKQFENLIHTGIPEDTRAYMGMMGFHIRINVHGDVIEIEQPGVIDSEEE